MPEFVTLLTATPWGYVVAHCPDVPNCYGVGADEEQALARLHGKIQDYLANRIERGEPVPLPRLEAGYLRVRVRGYKRATKADLRLEADCLFDPSSPRWRN